MGSHKYMEILEYLPQVEYLELNISSGTNYLETVNFLHDKPLKLHRDLSTDKNSREEETRM